MRVQSYYFLLVLLVCAAFTSIAQSSITVSNSITYQTINNTTNYGSSSIIGTARVSGKQLFVQFQNGGLATTNAMTGWIQISIDNVNWTTVQIYNPSVTNATIDTPQATFQNLNVYARAAIVTTNSVNAGAGLLLAPLQ